METRNDISAELATLSELVAGLPKVNVFAVPTGYFESVPATVMACLKDDPLMENNTGQTVPEGYFENLAGSILNKIKHVQPTEEAVDSLSPLLLSLRDKNVFQVPKGYFEGNDIKILNKISGEQMGEELDDLSQMLIGLRSKNVFSVPGGYFAGLADSILKRLDTGSAKVVRMPFRSKLVRFAAAAILVGAVSFGIVRYAGDSSKGLPAQDVAVMDVSIEKGRSMDDAQFNEALSSLSSADIANYLEKNGDITDIATLGNNLDEKELPSQEDYLLDDKTLENYLKQIDLTTLNN